MTATGTAWPSSRRRSSPAGRSPSRLPASRRARGGTGRSRPGRGCYRLWRKGGSSLQTPTCPCPISAPRLPAPGASAAPCVPFPPHMAMGRSSPDPASPSFNAPHSVVVNPLECQSNPTTQPRAWNQTGSAMRLIRLTRSELYNDKRGYGSR